MRRLLLFRHSTAESAEPGESDQTRPLTERGHRDAAAVGAYLANHALRPDRVLVSPAVRTRETWREVAAALRTAPAPVFDDRIYNATPHALLHVIAESSDQAVSLLVIAHNPGLHELATTLVATGDIETRERLRENFPTSGLAVLDFAMDRWSNLHPRSARLERFISPQSIAAATN